MYLYRERFDVGGYRHLIPWYAHYLGYLAIQA